MTTFRYYLRLYLHIYPLLPNAVYLDYSENMLASNLGLFSFCVPIYFRNLKSLISRMWMIGKCYNNRCQGNKDASMDD